MAKLITQLEEKGLAHPPVWLANNCHYLTQMGSVAYGCSTDKSDFDLYGFAIPPKYMVFPHLAGAVRGFGKEPDNFSQWQEHHVFDPEALGGKGREYDFAVYGIVNYFNLLMQNNANVIDSIFTPLDCVIHCTSLGQIVRDNRRAFLHKGCWHRYRGYAHSQLHKMSIKEHKGLPELQDFERLHKISKDVTFQQVEKLYKKRDVEHKDAEIDHLTDSQLEEYYLLFSYMMKKGKRGELVKRFGIDTKFQSHVVRLLLQVEQVMEEGELDLRRNSELLKSIRRGEWTEEQTKEYFSKKEKELETLYANSVLPWGPDEDKIKALLLNCLEAHYGSLDNCIVTEDAAVKALREIAEVIDRNRKVLGA